MFRDRLDWDVWLSDVGLLPVTASALAAIRATAGLDRPVIADARPLRVAA